MKYLLSPFIFTICILFSIGCANRESKSFPIIIEKTDDGYGFRCDNEEIMEQFCRKQDSDKSRHVYIREFNIIPGDSSTILIYGIRIHPRDDGICRIRIDDSEVRLSDSMVGSLILFEY